MSHIFSKQSYNNRLPMSRFNLILYHALFFPLFLDSYHWVYKWFLPMIGVCASPILIFLKDITVFLVYLRFNTFWPFKCFFEFVFMFWKVSFQYCIYLFQAVTCIWLIHLLKFFNFISDFFDYGGIHNSFLEFCWIIIICHFCDLLN